jgi:hypothetical protein
MVSYTTEFENRVWGDTGIAPPETYSYSDNVPPIEEYDDWLTHNLISDIKHLVTLTNKRLESGKGLNFPATPEDGQLHWDTALNRLYVQDASNSTWHRLARHSALNSHATDTDNPHNVTAAQVGAAVAGHTHDDRYYTESEVDSLLDGKADAGSTSGSTNGIEFHISTAADWSDVTISSAPTVVYNAHPDVKETKIFNV